MRCIPLGKVDFERSYLVGVKAGAHIGDLGIVHCMADRTSSQITVVGEQVAAGATVNRNIVSNSRVAGTSARPL